MTMRKWVWLKLMQIIGPLNVSFELKKKTFASEIVN